MPGVINDLRGRRFGMLRVPRNAEPEIRDHNAYWPVVCDCGQRKTVRGKNMVQGRTVSCGCYRADPGVRSAARLQISPRERKRRPRGASIIKQ